MPEEVQNNKTIIIQPGSFYLKIGLASFEIKPAIIHHVIARKKIAAQPMEAAINAQFTADFNNIFDLNDFHEDAINATTCLQLLPLPESNLHMNSNSVLCENVFLISNMNEYSIRFPIRYGDLNHSIYSSSEELSNDLQLIWTYALVHRLGIDQSQFKNYRIILLVPDSFKIIDIQIMVNLILKEMNFSSCLILQESVSASFWIGSLSSCVVDIGNRKTSISCISEGISRAKSRIKLNWGCLDYAKELFCSINFNAIPSQDRNITPALYKFFEDISREILLLPTVNSERLDLNIKINSPLFRSPTTFGINHEKIIKSTFFNFLTRKFDQNNNSIVFPFFYPIIHIAADYLFYRADIGTRYKKPSKGSQGEGKSNKQNAKENSQNLNQSLNTQGGDTPVESINNTGEVEEFTPLLLPSLVSLADCIHHSIHSCEKEENRRQYYSNILLTGGGGADNIIVRNQLKSCLEETLCQITDIKYNIDILETKNVPSQLVSWMGSVVLEEIEVDENLWIQQSSFLNKGSRVIRERSLFQTTNLIKI